MASLSSTRSTRGGSDELLPDVMPMRAAFDSVYAWICRRHAFGTLRNVQGNRRLHPRAGAGRWSESRERRQSASRRSFMLTRPRPLAHMRFDVESHAIVDDAQGELDRAPVETCTDTSLAWLYLIAFWSAS